MYNNPFFTNIPDIGDLDIEYVIIEDVCPILFTLLSKTRQRYIAVCCDLYNEQRWVISPISNQNLTAFLTNKISMRNAFLTQKEEKAIISHWSKEKPELRYDFVGVNEIPERDLPSDEYLEADDNEFSQYISTLSEKGTYIKIVTNVIFMQEINLGTIVIPSVESKIPKKIKPDKRFHKISRKQKYELSLA